MNIQSLTREQRVTRRRILDIIYEAGVSHIGSCLSSVDLIDCIYRLKRPDEPFILSNGHAAVALYVVLEKHGIMKEPSLKNLSVHPDRNPALGIDVSTGSLGQGLPIAVGMALADRSKNVYCMISDGESTQGSIWEALRIAGELKLNNLKIVVNANSWAAYGPISLDTLKKRFNAFVDTVITVNGHDMNQIVMALKTATNDSPLLVFAKTTVEQLPFLKGQDAHYYVMSDDDYRNATGALNG